MSYYPLISMMPKAVGNQLLLDTYTGAAVAYSLRKLRTAYTGSAIRVRRSNDNAEQDIGFVGNDLDTTTMLDFVGYNMWTYSEDISQSVYAKNNLNTTGTPAYIDVQTAPDGTLTGDKVIENTTNSSHNVARTSGALGSIGTIYNISVYLKQGERTKVQIYSRISGSDQTCDVDLTNGNISNNGFANTPTVTSEPNGWYRFSVTITSGTSSNANGCVVRLSNGTTTIYTGDGTSGCYVWGFQLSQTSSVKTYQKTVATASGNGFVTTWYDQSENANNATQATAANQAQIVASGTITTDPVSGKISSLWTNSSYALDSSITMTQTHFRLGVFNRTASGTRIYGVGANVSTPKIGGWDASNSISSGYGTGTATHSASDTSTGKLMMTVLRDSSNNVKCWLNNTALTTGTSSGTSNPITHFGAFSTVTTAGYKQEEVYWASDQESNRTGIETNANTYWTIY